MVNKFVSWTRFRNDNEQELIQNLVDEAIQFVGMDVYYVRRSLVETDTFYGESVLNTLSNAFVIEMYFDNPDGYSGAGAMINKLGLMIGSQANFVVSKRRFSQVVTEIPRPFEGDLIYVPMTKDWWEIKKADSEDVFYQLGQVTSYKLIVEKFQYSSERINTGIAELDKLQTALSHDFSIPSENKIADNTKITNDANAVQNTQEVDPFSEGNF
jgi:hypothetical protein